MTHPSGIPAGWYADPTNPGGERFWDGATWSHRTRAAAPGPRPPGTPAHARQGSPTAHPWWQTWWAIVPGIALCFPIGLVGLWKRHGTSVLTKGWITAAVVALLTVAVATDDGAPVASEPAGLTGALPAASSPTPTASAASATPTPTRIAMPAVAGLSLPAARRTLGDVGLDIADVIRRPSVKKAGTVIGQSIRKGTGLAPGTTVSLIVAAPLPRIPVVAGFARADAVRALREAGFRVRVEISTATGGDDGTVLRLSPRGGARAKPHSVVVVTVLDVQEPEPARPEENCTPGYSPCLPPASDYDCAGGGGNGPEYVYGTVKVTGSDPYDLDRDGDGLGCD